MDLWNTNILNHYVPAPDHERLLAEVEKTLQPYEKLPQPRIASVVLDVQIFPGQARALTSGRYRLENRTAQPIDHLHVGWGSVCASTVWKWPAPHWNGNTRA